GQRHIQVVASRFGRKATAPGWPRPAVSRQPVAKLRLAAHELAAGGIGVVPLVMPGAVYQQSHGGLLSFVSVYAASTIFSSSCALCSRAASSAFCFASSPMFTPSA